MEDARSPRRMRPPRDSRTHVRQLGATRATLAHTRESNRSSPHGRREPLPAQAPPHADASLADALLVDLNPEQRAAAAHGDGPLLIVAGAGTGKTATLAHRVAHLIAQRHRPRAHPAAHLHAPRRERDGAPRRRHPAQQRRARRPRALRRARLGRHLPRGRRAPAAHPRARPRHGAGLHDPGPRRLRGPHAPRPHRARAGPQRLALPAEVHVPRHLLAVRERAAPARRGAQGRRSRGAARPRTTSSSSSPATPT